MSTSANSNVAILNPAGTQIRRRSAALGDEITELYGYISAATYRLLEMIREFDPVRPHGGKCTA